MKIALVSDIHSNVFALTAVIEDIRKRDVDVSVNLGDILYGPIAPQATYDLLMKHDFITISGNQDRQIYESSIKEIECNPTLQFILDDVNEDALNWLKHLPFDHQLTNEVYLCHGSPTSDLIYLLENVEEGQPVLRRDEDILGLLAGQKSAVICCGHTHISRAVSLNSGQIVVNPGSVGLQAYTDEVPVIHSMENFNSYAAYAIIEKQSSSPSSAWNVQFIKVPYDVESAVKASQLRKREDWAHFLRTGRKLPKPIM